MSTKEQLELYKKEFKGLTGKLFGKGFDTDKELKQFEIENQVDFDRYYFLVSEIKSLEWALMTPEERKRQEEIAIKIEKKRGNKTR